MVDKDILEMGNKVYCPEKCRFVPHRVNCLFGVKNSSKRFKPTGVKDKNEWGYEAQICIDGKKTMLGYFKTAEDAYEKYAQAKKEAITRVANEEYEKGLISNEIYNSLINWDLSLTSEET